MATKYRKHFIALESNPDVFTKLSHSLGLSESLAFYDVLSLDDPDLLAFIPRPVHALILVFPASQLYDTELEKRRSEVTKADGGNPDVLWFKQTINNACGLYAILHAVTNGKQRNLIRSNTTLSRIVAHATEHRDSAERALFLEDSSELEAAYTTAALQGDTEPPSNAEDEVEFHYICFIRGHPTGRLYALDGEKEGPVDLGVAVSEEGDLLSEEVLPTVRGFIERSDDSLNLSLIALAQSSE